MPRRRDEDAALKALASYAERYAAVAEHTGVSFPSTITFDVAERVPGGPATAFAAPECRRPFPQVTVQADRATVTSAASRRLAGLVTAAWATFDEIAAALLSPYLASGGHHLAGAAGRGGLLQHARNDPGLRHMNGCTSSARPGPAAPPPRGRRADTTAATPTP